MSLSYFVQQLLNGLSLGGAYALIAIGYTMVYGILRMINFAHGDEFMMAGYFMIYSIAVMPWFLSIPVVILLTILMSVLIERAAYKPLRSAPRMSVMISAIGVRNIVENKVDLTKSRNLIIAAVIFVCGLGFTGGLTFEIGGTSITLTSLAIASIAGIVLNAILPGNDYEFPAGESRDEHRGIHVKT